MASSSLSVPTASTSAVYSASSNDTYIKTSTGYLLFDSSIKMKQPTVSKVTYYSNDEISLSEISIKFLVCPACRNHSIHICSYLLYLPSNRLPDYNFFYS